jgi:hypothetical protein
MLSSSRGNPNHGLRDPIVEIGGTFGEPCSPLGFQDTTGIGLEA